MDYPPDGWLRGYFVRQPVDVLGANQTPTGAWKSVDFLRLRDVALHLLGPLDGRTVLDLGCANGATMVYCGLQGARVFGQDLDEAGVEEANRLLRRFGIEGQAKAGDARRLLFDTDFFDAVIASDFFEHITDDVKVEVLREVRRVLKPGAPLVIKTPNLDYLRLSLLYKRLRAVLRLQNPFRLVIPHTPGAPVHQEHVGLTTRFRLTRCLLDAGFLNYRFHYAPLRRFGRSALVEILSTEVPALRDWLCEDLFCLAHKPIALSHFPD